jgi:hypothetical protein
MVRLFKSSVRANGHMLHERGGPSEPELRLPMDDPTCVNIDRLVCNQGRKPFYIVGNKSIAVFTPAVEQLMLKLRLRYLVDHLSLLI